jgi:hypothetical protein
MRLRRFGAATRNESGPQSRVTCHYPAALRAARPPLPSRNVLASAGYKKRRLPPYSTTRNP